MLEKKIILMFHNVRKDPKSKYDISWKKFKLINLLIFKLSKFLVTFKKDNILITFDDGYLPQLKSARYISLFFKIKSIIFISTKYIDSPGYISSKQLERNTNKSIVFGSHGHEHVSLNDKLSKSKIRNEIHTSKYILERLSNTEIKNFSFPNGDYCKFALEVAREIGFKYIFTSKRASNRRRSHNNTYNRFVVMKRTPILLLIIAYFGFLDDIQSLKKKIWIKKL
jgi:peptidoglycan/xylan/chitin deacetylase (PgdA/CDA1 family)